MKVTSLIIQGDTGYINGDSEYAFIISDSWGVGGVDAVVLSFLEACYTYELQLPYDLDIDGVVSRAMEPSHKRTNGSTKTLAYDKLDVTKLSDNELRYAVAQKIMFLNRFCTLRDTRDILVYNASEGVYEEEKGLIRELVETELGPDATPTAKKVILEHIQDSTLTDRQAFDPDIKMLHLNNCWLDYTNGKTYPHSPDRLSREKIPVDYDPKASCPGFERFLDQVLYPEEKEPMLDAMAYTFYRDHIADTINILVGTGANGKSVLLHVLEKLHGESQVSHVSLKDLMFNRFSKANLEGKNVNFTTETARLSHTDMAILKEITDNGMQSLERKGIQAYQGRLWAKIWTATNTFPSFDDDSDGITRRLNIFDFPNQFEGDKDDPKLRNKLTTPNELSGIMNLLIPRLKRIAETKQVVMAQKSIAERRRAMMLAKDPMKSFEEDCLREPTGDENDTKDDPVRDCELKRVVYSAFLIWCEANKVPKLSEDAFGRGMKATLNKTDRRISINGKREWFWYQLKLNEFVREKLPKL